MEVITEQVLYLDNILLTGMNGTIKQDMDIGCVTVEQYQNRCTLERTDLPRIKTKGEERGGDYDTAGINRTQRSHNGRGDDNSRQVGLVNFYRQVTTNWRVAQYYHLYISNPPANLYLPPFVSLKKKDSTTIQQVLVLRCKYSDRSPY